MPKELFEPVLKLISSFMDYELGSTHSYIIFGSCLAAWIIVARVFLGLFKSDRGFTAAFLALVFPLFFGLLAYALAKVQVVPRINADWADPFLAIAISGLVAILVILITSRRLFQLDGLSAIFIFTFASAAALAAFFGAEVTLKTIEKGSTDIKQREERTKKEIDSVL